MGKFKVPPISPTFHVLVNGTDVEISVTNMPATFSWEAAQSDNTSVYTISNGKVVWSDGTILQYNGIDVLPTDVVVEGGTYTTRANVAKVSIDLTTLSGWGNVADGQHSIQVVAKADGYKDSEKSTAVSFTKSSIKKWVFGVSGINSSSPQLTRTDDAVGKTWSKDSNGLITTGFEEEFNFQRVVDSKGNVFIRIPKMYRYFEGGDVLKIANYKVNDKYVLYPMFIKNDGTECDYVDVGAYKGHVTNDTSVAQLLESKSGIIPTYSKTRAQFREYAANNTDSAYVYYQRDIRNMTWVQDMIQIVFATRQTTDFQGTTWKSYGTATGDTDSIVNNSLTNPLSVCGLNSDTYGFKLFGIEDLCGNGFEFIDGITFNGTSCYYTYNTTKFSDSYNSDGMTYVSYGRNNSNSYISKLGYNASHPCINIPTGTSGSSSTYYCDYNYYSSSGVVLYTGANGFTDYSGFWTFRGNYKATYADARFGSRLCRQPL